MYFQTSGIARAITIGGLFTCLVITNHGRSRASGEALLLPPRSVFMLPPSLTGTPYTLYGSQASTTSHFSSGDALTTYWWSVLPIGMNKPSLGSFSVTVMRSAALASARSASFNSDASHGCIGNGSGCSTTSPPNTPLLGKPGGGWLRGVCTQSVYCAYAGGATYRNVFFVVEVDCEGPHAARCTQWTDRLIRLLVGHLESYAGVPDTTANEPPARQPTINRPVEPAPLLPPSSLFYFSGLGHYNGGVYSHTSQGIRVDDWTLKPSIFTGNVGATYHIFFYRNNKDALVANQSIKTQLMNALSAVTLQQIDLHRTELNIADLHAWMFITPNIHCDTNGGFVFRNIVVLMGVNSQDNVDTCTSKVQWAADTEARILNAASDYGLTH